jgi:hypothetical protein
LIRVHSLLRGELLKHQAGQPTFVTPDACQEQMAHLAAVLGFLGIDFDPSKLKPRKAWPKIGPLGHSELRAGVLAVLKQAAGWQSYREIADGVLRMHKVELAPDRHPHFLQKVRDAVLVLKGRGAVVAEKPIAPGDSSALQRWRLSPLFD